MSRYVNRNTLAKLLTKAKQRAKYHAETVQILSDEIPLHRMTTVKLSRVQKARTHLMLSGKLNKKEVRP